MTNTSKHYATVDGVRMAYTESGVGDPIVFLDGDKAARSVASRRLACVPRLEVSAAQSGEDLVPRIAQHTLWSALPGFVRARIREKAGSSLGAVAAA